MITSLEPKARIFFLRSTLLLLFVAIEAFIIFAIESGVSRHVLADVLFPILSAFLFTVNLYLIFSTRQCHWFSDIMCLSANPVMLVLAVYALEDNDVKGVQALPGYLFLAALLFSTLSHSIRVVHVIKSRGDAFKEPFNVLYGCDPSANPTVILGKQIWQSEKQRFSDRLAMITRTLVALCLFGGLCILSLISIILDPVSEQGLTASEQLYTKLNLVTGPVPLNVVAYIDPATVPINDLGAALDVSILSQGSNHTSKCSWIREDDTTIGGGKDYQTFGSPALVKRNFCLNVPMNNLHPEILVTVNFSGLALNSSTDRVGPVSVLIGLINDTQFVLENTAAPVPLLPGSHLFGSYTYHYRQTYSLSTRVAVLGIFSDTNTNLITNINRVFPDPLPQTSAAGNVATLRLVQQNDFTSRLVIRDNTDRTVLHGFSVVGGLWTFLNGFFAIFYGCSIFFALFEMKPIWDHR